ncbi:MAG: holo-ACP synthase, partial [bacterium]
PVESIHNQTIIDKRAIPGSILIHRMYAAISKEAKVPDDYFQIKTYGELRQRMNGGLTAEVAEEKQEATEEEANQPNELFNFKGFKGVGIDLEMVNNLPDVEDYRTDAFYIDNFSEAEISYCILQPEPKASFAGLFAAKEAMIKANGKLKARKFNQLEVQHDEDGKPIATGFQISISHAGGIAVAVALLGES